MEQWIQRTKPIVRRGCDRSQWKQMNGRFQRPAGHCQHVYKQKWGLHSNKLLKRPLKEKSSLCHKLCQEVISGPIGSLNIIFAFFR